MNTNTINTTITKHTNKVITFLSLLAVVAFTVVALFLTSCDKVKDQQPDQKEITVQVKAEGLHITELKSFDPQSWIYNYNPNVYNLTFTGTHGNNYTYPATVAQLSQGISVKVLKGDTYTITYQTQHPMGVYDTKLDIAINEQKTINTSADLTLTAHNSDYLIVVDNQSTSAGIFNFGTGSYVSMATSPDGTFFYAYMNEESLQKIQYRDENGTFERTINPTIGNIYHIVKPSVNGSTGINIIPFTYQEIIW